MAKLKLDNLNKIYPSGVQAVYDFSIDIEDGEFIVFVGPSGCGKTTTLRMIAGLESITSGTLTIEDKVVNNLSPRERDIAMAFQNYALYDQMTVYHNMAFSLTLLRKPAEEIHNKVMKAAKMLELEPVLNRKPKQLSGGQKQRVALGRAIVRNPKVFLLDEPLSNLDVKLRDSARKELADLHRQLKATFVYVTHDQIEAMTLATRIVILDKGCIQQIGTPSEVYNNPNNIFVATFIGSPAMNIFNAEFENMEIHIDGIRMPISNELRKILKEKYTDKTFKLGIRPEDMIVSKDKISEAFEQKIDFVEFLGESTLLHFTFGGEKMVAKVISKLDISAGETINILFDINKIKLFDSETGVRIN